MASLVWRRVSSPRLSSTEFVGEFVNFTSDIGGAYHEPMRRCCRRLIDFIMNRVKDGRLAREFLFSVNNALIQRDTLLPVTLDLGVSGPYRFGDF
jgi:hypothetical protein